MRYLFAIIVFGPLFVQAQTTLSISTGHGSYLMSDMKVFQKQIDHDFPVNARITESFPAFVFFQASVVMQPKDPFFFKAVSIAFGSTGGRVHYSDYSGAIGFDQLLNFISASGFVGGTLAFEEKYLFVQAGLKPGIVMSGLNMKFYQQMGDEESRESYKFTSLNLTAEPTILLTKEFGRVGVHAFAGYNITVVSGKLFSKENEGAFLIGSDNKPLKADWTGYRFGVGLDYTLPQL